MPVPGILKSKAFWSFSTVFSGISGAVAYDRYEASLLRKKFMAEASEYGKQPLASSESPRSLNFVLLSADSTHHRALRDNFRIFAVELLTVAGVDYKWIVEADGDEVARKWDELARETNKPELMLEGTDKTTTTGSLISREELKINILKPSIKALLSRTPFVPTINPPSDPKEAIWTLLRQNFCSFSVAESPIEIVTFDHFTQEAIADEIKVALESIPEGEPRIIESKKTRSWFSRSKKTDLSQQQLPVLPTVSLFHIPLEFSQTLSARLKRFLFGQRELTQTIGEAVLEIIRK